MKKHLTDEGNKTATNCNGLKMIAVDGKQRIKDIAETDQLLPLIQSVPFPKAKPFKRWQPELKFGSPHAGATADKKAPHAIESISICLWVRASIKYPSTQEMLTFIHTHY
jgi:hypothetical protein